MDPQCFVSGFADRAASSAVKTKKSSVNGKVTSRYIHKIPAKKQLTVRQRLGGQCVLYCYYFKLTTAAAATAAATAADAGRCKNL